MRGEGSHLGFSTSLRPVDHHRFSCGIGNLSGVCSTRDRYFLVKPTEERLFVHNLVGPRPRQEFGDFLPPQIECERLERGEQRPPKIAKGMPPTGHGIIDNQDLAPRFYDAKCLAQRPLAIMAWLLMQQEKNQRP